MCASNVGESGHRRVLIVDDDEGVTLLLKRFFEGLGGFDVATAANAQEGLTQVVHFRPDLVLLDIVMPGLGGTEVCRRIKALPATRRTKVLLMTGYATPENRKAAASCGADAFMPKPIALPALKRWVRDHLSAQERT